MDLRVFVVFIHVGFGLITCSHDPSMVHRYHYINQPMTWTDAQRYCREKYTDLATTESMDDINKLNRLNGDTSFAWIGLNDNPQSWKYTMGNDSNSWRWSATGQTITTGYSNWHPTEPGRHGGNQFCGQIGYSNGLWSDDNCAGGRYFICHDDNSTGQRTYTVVQSKLSWTDAQTYCRTHHTDLATINNQQQLTQVLSVIQNSSNTDYLWFGLYRVPWTWSDGSNSSLANWKSGQPNNYGLNQHCVGEYPDHTWGDEGCNTEYPFWCHEVLRQQKKTMLRIKFKSGVDLSDEAVQEQIVQQLTEKLRQTGVTDVKLTWKIQPKKLKEEEEEEEPETKCDKHDEM